MAIFLSIVCFAFWVTADLDSHLPSGNENLSTIIKLIQFDLLHNLLSYSIITLIFTMINAFLLAQLNSQYSLIRTRTFLPILVFMILMSAWTETHILNQSHIALTLFIVSLFYFFNMSKDTKGVEQAFMGSFAIGIASLLINPLIFLMPFYWIGILMFQSFSMRTFLASVFGLLCPWILYLSTYVYLYPNDNLLLALNADLILGLDLTVLPITNIVYIASLCIVLLIGILGVFTNTHGDAIQTRTRLNFLVLLLFALSIITVIYSQEAALFLPLLALIYALLVSHAFTLKENNFYSITFIVFCILNIVFIVTKLINI